MSIVFYSMNRCGHCGNAKNILKDQIASGEIVEKDASEAPVGVAAFPYFQSSNGKSHTGCPQSHADLLEKLGVGVENYQDENVITFYSMNGCGHCLKAKKALAKEIASGKVTLKDASEASGKFLGYPAFECNGKTHLGAVQSYAALLEKLGMSENYIHPQAQRAQAQRAQAQAQY